MNWFHPLWCGGGRRLLSLGLCNVLLLFFVTTAWSAETWGEITARLNRETTEAYAASPFSEFSGDYFARLTRDPSARVGRGEVEITSRWRIEIPPAPALVTTTMRGYFEDFMARRMDVKLTPSTAAPRPGGRPLARRIVWRETGGGVPDVPESYTLEIGKDGVLIQGRDAPGLRDGIVRLTDLMGLRQAPMLPTGRWVVKPRIPVRLGVVPGEGSLSWSGKSSPDSSERLSGKGSLREAVLLGYNAVFVPGGSLFALSTSDAIPELKNRREPALRERFIAAVRDTEKHALKAYCWLDTRQKFAQDHPVFQANPELRGTRTWKADGDFVLCTEHPLVKRYLAESVEGLVRAAPSLQGIVIIIGGEGFYHCYMRSFGAAKGHSACPRCDRLGAEQTVANLCNLLADSVRKVNPQGEVVAWPYSAEFVWSADRDQAGLMRLLRPGGGILTEVEKDEDMVKPEGFTKHLDDYSIDLIGPGERARRQIAAAREAGIPIYLKTEPELGFEAPRLPFIPCLDRWLARADAIAASGATGAWMFPAFKPMYASSTAEVPKFALWEPGLPLEEILQQLATRIAGPAAGAHLREAWKQVSEAIPFSPEQPPYYTGPHYLGPGQPMCADPSAKVPDVFLGRYLFLGEMTDAEGLRLRPTYDTSPRGSIPLFGPMYRQMETHLRAAVDLINQAEPLVPPRLRTLFASETSPIRWFYHTARTQANFYESCDLRDKLLALAAKTSRTSDEQAEASRMLHRWRAVLADEKRNTEQARPVMAADMRLDYYYGADHMFSHGVDVLDAKLKIISVEIDEFLPKIAARCR